MLLGCRSAQLSTNQESEMIMNRKVGFFLIVLGFIAYLANGISICFKFSIDIHAWFLGFVPAAVCILALLRVRQFRNNLSFLSFVGLCSLGFVSLIAHLIFCEILALPVPYFDSTMSIIYKSSCYLLPVNGLLFLKQKKSNLETG